MTQWQNLITHETVMTDGTTNFPLQDGTNEVLAGFIFTINLLLGKGVGYLTSRAC
jgi:hypothetical protein